MNKMNKMIILYESNVFRPKEVKKMQVKRLKNLNAET